MRRAAVRATLAPSVHNTQPWRFVIGTDALDVYADWTRRLQVLDPRGRQLLISCGCAVLNARVVLAASGHEPTVARFPDPLQPDLLARLTLDGPVPDGHLASLDPMIEARHTNRRRFSDETVPDAVVSGLVSAAGNEGVKVVVIARPEDRRAVAVLTQRADRLEQADPGYQAELRAWTTDDWSRRDGVPMEAVPRSAAGSSGERLRNFDPYGLGWLPIDSDSNVDGCLLLFVTTHDTPDAWVRVGEALQRVLLEATQLGYVASPLTQLIEVADTNARLREQLDLQMHPHVLLRVGRAATTPASRRRRLVDVLETSG